MRNYRVGRAAIDGGESKMHLEVGGALVPPHTASAGVLEPFSGDGFVSWQSLPLESRCTTCDADYHRRMAFLETGQL